MMLTWVRTGRTAAAGVLACALLLAAYLVWFLGGWGSAGIRSLVTDGMYVPLAVAYTIFGVRVAFSPRQQPRTRRAWRWMALAFAGQPTSPPPSRCGRP